MTLRAEVCLLSDDGMTEEEFLAWLDSLTINEEEDGEV